jgi:uncharacterized SAM-binding protein YcdF (DUF218 family)
LPTHTLSKLAIALVSPLGTALLLGLLGLLLLPKARRAGATLLVIGLAWLWFWSTPAASDALQQELEGRYPARAAESLPRADAIVVLGGAMAPPSPGQPYPDLGSAADRVWHAARVFRAGKAPLVLASGGSDPEVSRVAEAEIIAGLLVELGVPAAAILRESASRNTRENAVFSVDVLRPRQVKSILLVTSALHMPRAVAEFERVGFQVIPAATDHAQAKWGGVQRWLPDTGALDTSARGMKEVVGKWAVGRR